MDLNIDRFNWTKVRLGEVVEWYQKDIPNELQSKQKIEYYITASEIDGDEVSITRYKELSDGQKGPTITKHFEKGDLLLSTRSVALRKAAIAPVSGVTGEKLLVLRCVEGGRLDPKLMPFVFQSAHFWHYAQNSASGSVNKFTSWTKLAKYEFLLPPKDQQAELAELLWAMNNAFEQNLELKNSLSSYFERMKNDSVTGKFSSNSNNWKQYVFGSLGNSYGGLTGKTKNDFGEGKPFINYMNVFSNAAVNPSQFDRVRIGNNENQNEIKLGDILFTGSSETPEEVGMASVVLDDLSGYYLNSFCFGFRLNDFETLRPEYAKHLMRSAFVRQFMTRRAQGSTRFNISKSVIKEN